MLGPSYRTLGCGNGPFVMAVISPLCSQVELRWDSTGSHCAPIFRTLKEICWVLKGWNEARGASADPSSVGKYTVETQWEQSCPSVSFCALLNLTQCRPFTVAFLTEQYCLIPVCLSLFAGFWEKTQRLMRWQPRLCQSLEDPSGFITHIPPSVGYANKVWDGGF